MNEAVVNTIIKNMFNEQGVAYKIPDPGKGEVFTSIERPFDGFGTISIDNKQYPMYWEAKYSNTLKAFNFKNSLREHQAEWLDKFSKVENSYNFVILGVDVSNRDKRLYIFDWPSYRKYFYGFEENNKTINSVNKNILETLKYIPIIKKQAHFDVNKINY